ncbi:hypothetical protein IH601_12305 [Candidatus Bipolaricaulota bacterium]|jgi:hypothetical protein|nr:hypothetical protein [Candidatus Bipolaricaulota bacterium]TFH10688.1 MAG: hypothetical protein E4H08_03135 [Candidatus Atribacteria bacterium]
MINPEIVVALVIQWIVGKISRVGGAVISYLITTGILVWGLGLYAQGDGIAFLGMPLSQWLFVLLCIIWYASDTRGLIRARKLSEEQVRQDLRTSEAHQERPRQQ